MSKVLERADDRLHVAAVQHPADQELRRRGYSIYARPRGKPAVWVKKGKRYRQIHQGCIHLEQEERT